MDQEGEHTANTKKRTFSGNEAVFKKVDTELLQS